MGKYQIFLDAMEQNNIDIAKESLLQNYQTFIDNYWLIDNILSYNNLEIVICVINYLLDNKIYKYFKLLEEIIYSNENVEILKIILKRYNANHKFNINARIITNPKIYKLLKKHTGINIVNDFDILML